MATANPGYEARTGSDGRSYGATRERRSFTETKAFYKTSEFMVWLASVVGVLVVLVVTYLDDSDRLTEWRGWILVAILSAAYMLSRGFAKSGSREPYTASREDY